MSEKVSKIPDLSDLLQKVEFKPEACANWDCPKCHGIGVDSDGLPCDCAYLFVAEQVVQSLIEDLDRMRN